MDDRSIVAYLYLDNLYYKSLPFKTVTMTTTVLLRCMISAHLLIEKPSVSSTS